MESHKTRLEAAGSLIEQGNKAGIERQHAEARMVEAERRVAYARRNLASASEADENGESAGNVAQAQVQLYMAENELAAERRAYEAASRNLERINEQKEIQIQELENYRTIEKSNLEKLMELDRLLFPENARKLSEGIERRLEEAENARVALLRSMGKNANPDFIHTMSNAEIEPERGSAGTGIDALEGSYSDMNRDHALMAVECTEADFNAFAQKYGEKTLSSDEKAAMKERKFHAEVRQMAATIAPDEFASADTWEREEISPEELAQLDENDPGYVGGRVQNYEDKNYIIEGTHSTAWSQGGDLIGYYTSQPGSGFSRYGSEGGTNMFASDAGVQYEDLQMNVIQEKRTLNSYVVLRPFPMKASYVREQDFNKGNGQFDREKKTVQYETPVSVSHLIRHGFLRKV